MFTWVQASAYNISAAAFVYLVSTRARLKSFIVQSPGSAGNLVFNDSATLAGASTTNQIISIPNSVLVSAAAAGDIWPAPLDWPIENGLVVSAVPTGMVIAVAYAFLVN
jgi:hypothetical protein